MSQTPTPGASTPAAIRKAGLINAGVGLGGIVLGRVIVEVMLAFGSHSGTALLEVRAAGLLREVALETR